MNKYRSQSLIMNSASHFWNQRYKEQEFVYGEQPNVFFEEQLEELTPGKLLLPAEGEGRNAVWAAGQGWQVTAFDQAAAGRKKALELAQKKGVQINYEVSAAISFNTSEQFDVIGLIYAHFPASERKTIHKQLLQNLKPGGKIIFEAFSKNQLGRSSGGPKQIETLFSEAEIREEFPNVRFEFLREEEVLLREGPGHQGLGKVMRFIATKEESES